MSGEVRVPGVLRCPVCLGGPVLVVESVSFLIAERAKSGWLIGRPFGNYEDLPIGDGSRASCNSMGCGWRGVARQALVRGEDAYREALAGAGEPEIPEPELTWSHEAVIQLGPDEWVNVFQSDTYAVRAQWPSGLVKIRVFPPGSRTAFPDLPEDEVARRQVIRLLAAQSPDAFYDNRPLGSHPPGDP